MENTTGQYLQKQCLAIQKMHTFRSTRIHLLRWFPFQTILSLLSHKGNMMGISKFIVSDFIERANCRVFPGLQNLPQMNIIQIAINAGT